MSDVPSIMLDARKLGDGGIGVYIENLVDGFQTLSADSSSPLVNFTLLVPNSNAIKAMGAKGDYVAGVLDRWSKQKSKSLRFVEESSKKYSISEYMFLAWRQSRNLRRIDVFHAPHYTLPLFLPVPSVTTVHDIIHVAYPDTSYHSIIGKVLIRSALQRSSHIITVSKASQREITREFGLSTAPITVIPNAVKAGIGMVSEQLLESFLDSERLLKPYCLFVGGARPHKRFSLLLDVWAELAKQFSDTSYLLPLLVVVGSGFPQTIYRKIDELGLLPHVRFFSDVSTSFLSNIYSGSMAVLIPSLEEGFGLVALEALKCGSIVVSAPLPSVQEICGRDALYADDFSMEAFLRVVRDLLANNSLAPKSTSIHDKKRRCERAELFSLESVARRTLSVYETVMEQRC